jgi:fluoride exporter
MRKYIYIGLGGFFGAVLRFFIKSSTIFKDNEIFPLDTLLINVLGCFLIALFLTLCIEVMEIDPDIRLGAASGFIGAFTTFSAVCKEVVVLLECEYYFLAISYTLASICLGIIAVYTGMTLAKVMIIKFINSDKITDFKDDINNNR